jgi:hypothetical protein
MVSPLEGQQRAGCRKTCGRGVVPQFDLQPIDIVSRKFQTEALPIGPLTVSSLFIEFAFSGNVQAMAIETARALITDQARVGVRCFGVV